MTYDHINNTDMQAEFRYHVFLNFNKAAIEIYTEQQVLSKSIFHDNQFGSTILLESFKSVNGYITDGLELSEKKAERCSLPVIVKFDYKVEPIENIAHRNKNKRWRIFERFTIGALLVAVIWKGSVLAISIYNHIG